MNLPKSPVSTYEGTPKGAWWRVGPDPFRVSIMCPECGESFTIHRNGEGHQIAVDGAVSPSVVCPYEGCRFHEVVKLESWQPA